MEQLEGRVAVVTGAASGIGRALAGELAAAGARVVLSDLEEGPLAAAVDELKADGRDALGVVTDVSDPDAVEELSRRTLDAYGAVHVVCNNAGVLADGDNVIPLGGGKAPLAWEHPLEDWHWTFGVNFWGVVHGIRAFVPLLLEEDEAHVVNTASIAGLTSAARGVIYGSTKHAVVRVTEALYLQLQDRAPHVGVSLLCPGRIHTRIGVAQRNRPDAFGGSGEAFRGEELARLEGEWGARTLERLRPADVAKQVVQSIRDRQFYVLTPDVDDARIRRRMEEILERRNPEAGGR